MISAEKLLAELIALPTVNPAFLAPGHPWAGEKRAAEYLAAVAARGGLEVELEPAVSERPILLATCRPSGKVRQRILLAPHLDTVGGDENTEELFQPRKAGGRLFGRGACDTKGSAAAMMSALLDLAGKPGRPAHTEVVFAGLIDEENQQWGSRHLVARRFKADLGIVGEPTSLRVVTAHKGDLWLQLECRGRSAHGAQPARGQNAIHAMARVVASLETGYADFLKRRPHPLLGPATINVGVIEGGQQPNIVPSRCLIQVDRRTLPGETESSVRREIAGWLRRQGLVCSCKNAKPVECLPLATDPHLPLVRQFCEQAGQHEPRGVEYFCDASILAHGGIPSVVFGPGNIAQAHTAREWISLRELEFARRLILRFLRSLP